MSADLSFVPSRVNPYIYGSPVYPTGIAPSKSIEIFHPKEVDQKEKIYLSRVNASGVIHVLPIWKGPDRKTYAVLDVTKRLPFSDRFCLEVPGGIWHHQETPDETVKRVLDSELSLSQKQGSHKLLALNEHGIAKSPGIIGELMYSAVTEVEGPEPKSKKPGVVGHVLVPLEQFLDNQKFENFLKQYQNFNNVLSLDAYKNLKVSMDVNVIRGLLDKQTIWKLNPLLALKVKVSSWWHRRTNWNPRTNPLIQDIPYPKIPSGEGVLEPIYYSQRSIISAPMQGTPKERDAWVINHTQNITAAVHDVVLLNTQSKKPSIDSLEVPIELNFRRPIGNVIELPAGKWEPNKKGQETAIDALNTELKEETGLTALQTTLLGGRDFGTSTGITGESKILGLTRAEGEMSDEGQTESEKKTIQNVFTVPLKQFLDKDAMQEFARQHQAVVGADVAAARGLLTKDAFKRVGIDI